MLNHLQLSLIDIWLDEGKVARWIRNNENSLFELKIHIKQLHIFNQTTKIVVILKR